MIVKVAKDMKDSPKHEAGHDPSSIGRDGILRELDRILANHHFCNSRRYPALLRHVVESTLDGKSDSLKERTLGVEIFGRPPDYDTNSDTVVRYTAAEVRKRLLLYYSEEGHDSEIRISLSPGTYVPEFQHSSGRPPTVHSAPQSPLNTSTAEVVPTRVQDLANELGHTSPPVPNGLPAAGLTAARRSAWGSLLVWAVVAAFVVIASLAGWRWRENAKSERSALAEFWAPLLTGQQSVLVCTGSVVFSAGNYSGTTTANRDVDYPFVSMQAAAAIARVSGLVERSGGSTQLIPSATTTLTQLQQRSVAFLGGYNNEWTMRLLQPARYHFTSEPIHAIVDSTQPRFQLERDHSIPYSNADDYAVVARFRDPVTDSWSMVLAGIGRNGTEAAADFATSPHYVQLLREQLKGGFANKNIEAVLKVKVIDGRTGAPTIVAAYAW